MDFSPIKNLIRIENIGCMFRTYQFYGKYARILICSWIAIEISILMLSIVSGLRNTTFVIIEVLYIYSVKGFSVILLCLAIYHSKKFEQLMMNFEMYWNIYGEAVYSQNLLRAKKTLTFMSISMLFLQQAVFVYGSIMFFDTDYSSTGLISAIFANYSTGMSHFRFIFEYYFLHAILFVISEQLDAITRSMDKEMMSEKQIDEGAENIVHNHAEMFDKWINAYKNIYKSTKLINAIFSAQLTMMLLIISAYYVMILYVVASLAVAGVSTPVTLFMNCYTIVIFLIAVFITSKAGQRVQNSSNELKCKLSQLCIQWVADEKQYRLTKDLLRYTRARPISIRVFGTNEMNMAVLPSFVAFFTSYTVIALQFNNVV